MDSPHYTLLRLRRDDPRAGQYLDTAMARIKRTSEQFDGSGDGLVNATWKLYAENSPLLGLWVALDDTTHEVIGHALGDIEAWGGRTVAWISQVMMDTVAPTILKSNCLYAFEQWVDEVNEWAKTSNMPWRVSELLMMSPRMTAAWARHAGFDEYRHVFRRLVR